MGALEFIMYAKIVWEVETKSISNVCQLKFNVILFEADD